MSGHDSNAEPGIRSWLVVEVAKVLGASEREALLQRASEPLRALLTSTTDRKGWAPIGLFIEAMCHADAITGTGDFSRCWDIGRRTAQHEVGAVASLALKVLKPATVMSMAASLWSVHYRNAGRVLVRLAGPSAILVSLDGFPAPHRAHCLAVGGWMQGTLERGPRSSVRVDKVSCRTQADGTCDYAVSWVS